MAGEEEQAKSEPGAAVAAEAEASQADAARVETGDDDKPTELEKQIIRQIEVNFPCSFYVSRTECAALGFGLHVLLCGVVF